MKQRITIMLDDDIAKKLRMIQSKKILKESKNVSFSAIIGETLRKNLK